MTSLPWRDRPASLERGYVLGSMTAGWPGFVAALAITVHAGALSLLWPSLLLLALAVLATYMWFHG